MKLLTLLTLSLVTISTSRSTNREHLERAAAQLNRLSAFRKTQQETSKVIMEKWPEISDVILNDNNREMSTQSKQKILMNADTMRKIDELATIAYEIVKHPNYNAIMQERIKRSGSGDFINGIAGKVINGVFGTSGASSGGSSGPVAHDSYGAPVQPYGATSYTIWDIKKAIINTLVQALKALAGGAIAVKGHLIKGGGFIVQTTGRVISSAGDAASSLGTQIASSAVISHPNPAYGVPGYAYDVPVNHDYSYNGPPPNPDTTYSQHTVHHHFGAPSDANPVSEPGLLLIKPVNDNEVHHHQHQYHNNENHHDDQAQYSQTSLSALEESFGGAAPKNPKAITKLVGLVTGTSKIPQTNQHNQHVEYSPAEHKGQPQPSLSSHHDINSQHTHNHPSPSSADHNPQHDERHNQYDTQPFAPEKLPGIPINQNHQIAYHEIQSLLNPYLRLPINEAQDFSLHQPSNYGMDSSFESLKMPIHDHQHQNIINIENYGAHGLPNGYGLPMHHGIGIESIYSNLKRMAISSPHLNKPKTRNIVLERAVDFKIKNSMLHRI